MPLSVQESVVAKAGVDDDGRTLVETTYGEREARPAEEVVRIAATQAPRPAQGPPAAAQPDVLKLTQVALAEQLQEELAACGLESETLHTLLHLLREQ